jgi:hypothetical protein
MGYEPGRNQTSVLNRYRRVDDASCYPCHAASWSFLFVGFRVDSTERLNRSRNFSRPRNWLVLSSFLDPAGWNQKCNEKPERSVISAEFVMVQPRRLKLMYAAASRPLTGPAAEFPGESTFTGKRRTASCGTNRNAPPKNRNWFTRSLGFRSLVPGDVF